MKIIHLFTALITLLTFLGTCLADSAVQGVRFGLQVGYGLLDSKVRISRILPPPASDSSDVAGRGILGGATVEWGNVVGNTDLYLGLEGSFTASTTKGKKSILGTFPLGGVTEDFTTSVFFRRSLDVAGKMGYLLRDVALPYVKLGFSSGHWIASSVSNRIGASGKTASTSIGFVVGLGADFPMSERLSMGIGYDYRYYKNFTHTLNDNVTQIALRRVVVTPSAHAIMFRATWKISSTDFTTSPPPKERKRKRKKNPQPEE